MAEAGIVLWGRKGPVASALVDAEDYERLSEHRWNRDRKGYAKRNGKKVVGEPRRTIMMHREIMGLSPGDGVETDHINRIPLDNRKSNLRVVTHAENGQNQTPRKGGSSKYRGVCRDQGKWKARGRDHHIGYFDDEDAAGAAAREWREANLSHAVD